MMNPFHFYTSLIIYSLMHWMDLLEAYLGCSSKPFRSNLFIDRVKSIHIQNKDWYPREMRLKYTTDSEQSGVFLRISENDSVIMIDGDNVRGKTKFCVTKIKLVEDLKKWIAHFSLQNRCIVYFDHGSRQEAFYFEPYGLVVAFSGRKKADDVMSRDVAWIQNRLNRNAVVVTEDLELRQRCKRAVGPTRISKKKEKKAALQQLMEINIMSNTTKSLVHKEDLKLSIVSSPSFVSLLYKQTESGLQSILRRDENHNIINRISPVHNTSFDDNSPQTQNQLELFKQELSLRQQLDNLERILNVKGDRRSNRKSISAFKRKHKLMSDRLQRFYVLYNQTIRSDVLNDDLINKDNTDDYPLLMDRSNSSQEENESSDESNNNVDDKNDVNIYQRGAALLHHHQQNSNANDGQFSEHLPAHKEETWQRVVLAEQLRLDFAAADATNTNSTVSSTAVGRNDRDNNNMDGSGNGDESEVLEGIDDRAQQMREYVSYYNSHILPGRREVEALAR